MELPREFVQQMQYWLGPQFASLDRALARSPLRAVRLHRTDLTYSPGAPASQENAGLPVPKGLVSALLGPVSWSSDGYYIPTNSRLGRHVHQELGVYYLQEPSAMAVVEALSPHPGERILDLCAAPGGKSSAIAKRLRGTGLLVANEIHPSRVVTLAQNLERLGVDAVITNESPDVLALRWPGLFDAILVDAPCSGEGMFRKDSGAMDEWTGESPAACASRQREILQSAIQMVRPGGRLVYSTCTFNPLENERMVEWLLETFDVTVEPLPEWSGFELARSDWTERETDVSGARRLWPHSGLGEGHFVCRLRVHEQSSAQMGAVHGIRGGSIVQSSRHGGTKMQGQNGGNENFRRFLTSIVRDPQESWQYPVQKGDVLFARPPAYLPLDGLRVLRPGVALAVMSRDRFEPHHHLSRHLSLQNATNPIAVDLDEARQYIEGNPIDNRGLDGYVWLHQDGFPVGFGKAVTGRINNRYPKGLRKAGLDTEYLPANIGD